MLKITSDNLQTSTRLTLEGRLAGAWVKELELFWRQMTASQRGSLIVDLRGMTFIEEIGKALLTEMWREGAELIGNGCCTKSIIQEIRDSQLPTSSIRRGMK